MFDIISGSLSPVQKKNLAEIAKMLTQITYGQPFGDDNLCLQSLNSYVIEAIPIFRDWFLEGEYDESYESLHF
jgi:Ras GTPase-activating-like protein IQGAP2/3